MGTYTELSLFSGVGGGLLATQHLLGWRTICYVEWDKYAIDVLKARIRDGYLDDAPIWDDAFTFDGRPWAGLVDVVTAGFPCQPFSTAGKGLAERDPRNGWPAVIRILREVQPRYAILENVPGLISKPYFRRILGELVEAGFDIEYDCISAQEIGANHKRERVWIVAHSKSQPIDMGPGQGHQGKEIHLSRNGQAQHVANPNNPTTSRQSEYCGETHARAETKRLGMGSEPIPNSTSYELGKHREPPTIAVPSGSRGNNTPREIEDVCWQWWAVEPRLGRVADGVANRLDRLKAIGNGQVPAVAATAWHRLTKGK
jgi:DNA (cytosine-5)-methyltransferase 1